MRVTITPEQRKQYIKVGNKLVQKKAISGFNLEDYDPSVKKGAYYGHDNLRHTQRVQQATNGGKIYPRESYYLWEPGWKLGKNTRLMFNKTLAHGKEMYFVARNSRRAVPFFRQRTFRKMSPQPMHFSWYTPDIRLYNATDKDYTTVYNVTKKIDHNSRFSTLIVKKKNLQKVRKTLKYERVKKVKVQHYRQHSLWRYIHGKEG